LLNPIIGLEFVVNGTNAQFLIDNIAIVKWTLSIVVNNLI
jgi:hypothetical protein